MASKPQKTCVAIDLGTATISAATVDEDGVIQPVLFPSGDSYAASLPVDSDGVLHGPDWGGEAVEWVGNITRSLANKPWVIADVPYSSATLIQMVTAPAVEQAKTNLGAMPDCLVAIIPNHWPDYIVDSYIVGLERHGIRVCTISPQEAIAASLPEHSPTGYVTYFDFGATSTSLSLVKCNRVRKRGEVTFHIVDPNGGERRVYAVVAGRIAREADPAFSPDRQWMLNAAFDVGEARLATHETDTTGDVTISLPDPIGSVNISARTLLDYIEEEVCCVIQDLIDRPEVTQAWEEDGGATPNLHIVGGYSRDVTAANALRSVLCGYDAVEYPAASLAVGAATVGAAK